MGLFRRHFRTWWQHPRKVGDRTEHRTVTFLELFYDLVYVVLIAQLAHGLAEHIDWPHFGQYCFLFIIVWWSWLNGMTYHDLHGNNDIRTRVITFLQMICVAAMAAFAHDAMGENSIPFALSYSAFQIILTFVWWRVDVHDPAHRLLSRPYTFAFLIATLLFLSSVFVPVNTRPFLWGGSVFISVLLPLIMVRHSRKSAEAQREFNKVMVASPSMVERYGLFTIIVLGEVVVGVVSGLSDHHHLTWQIGGLAISGILIAIGLWWIYFDYVSHRIPVAKTAYILSWTYLHLPLAAAIAGVGAAILNIVHNAGEVMLLEVKWLLVLSVAIVLLCVSLMIRTIQQESSHSYIYKTGSWIMLASAPIIGLLGLLDLPAIGLLSLVIVLLLTPVFWGLKTWLQTVVNEPTQT